MKMIGNDGQHRYKNKHNSRKEQGIVSIIIIIIIFFLYVLICNGTKYKHKLQNISIIYKIQMPYSTNAQRFNHSFVITVKG